MKGHAPFDDNNEDVRDFSEREVLRDDDSRAALSVEEAATAVPRRPSCSAADGAAPHVPPDCCVERRERVVEEEARRRVVQRAREAEALLLPTRKRPFGDGRSVALRHAAHVGDKGARVKNCSVARGIEG